jgi:hypothetical protein
MTPLWGYFIDFEHIYNHFTPSELFLRLIGLYPHASVNPPKFGQAECLALSKSKKLNANFPNDV